jgi:hypothetical protein
MEFLRSKFHSRAMMASESPQAAKKAYFSAVFCRTKSLEYRMSAFAERVLQSLLSRCV